MMDYQEFIRAKQQTSGMFGFDPLWMPDSAFGFQQHTIDWTLRKGRAAAFLDTGMGKTLIEFVFAQNVVEKTNKNVLILTPLAVSHQHLKEAEKFGIEAARSRDGRPAGKITITNYQQLEKFDPAEFECLICDESSAIKDSTGQTKTNVVRAASKMPYRLLCTATPSPNDFVELGTSSEALDEMPFMEMIDTFFRDTSNDKNPQWSTPKYEIRAHAVETFWKWVSSWAIAAKKPSDLGYDDGPFILPPLVEKEHQLKITEPAPGKMFVEPARTLKEQREERKRTINERSEKVAELCAGYDSSVIWAHYNYETDLLNKVVPDSVNVSGTDKDEAKEEKFIAFANGEIKNLITKPKIGAWGLNWQHCNHMAFFPSHSFEQYYQGVRRCYRFGQKRPVYVDIVTTDGEQAVTENIKRKAKDMETMFSMLVKFMNNKYQPKKQEQFEKPVALPEWLMTG
jgi:hypothetical protein